MGLFDGIFTGLAGGVLSSIGGVLGNNSAKNAASKQMEFQERMSDTAHQREVKDLRAAGLNPVLSGLGGGGASTPVGASYQPRNVAEGVSDAVNSALVARRLHSDLKTAEEQRFLMATQAGATASQGEASSTAASLNRALTAKAAADTLNSAANARITAAAAAKAGIDKQFFESTAGKAARYIELSSPVANVFGSMSGHAASSFVKGFKR